MLLELQDVCSNNGKHWSNTLFYLINLFNLYQGIIFWFHDIFFLQYFDFTKILFTIRDNHILNFLDAEANINDGELYEPKDEYIDHELAAADRKAKKEIRYLEAEIQKWQILVDKVRGDNPPDFDNQTLAVLRGRLVRYLMRSKEVHT